MSDPVRIRDNLELVNLLPDDEVLLAVDQWKLDREGCIESITIAIAESGAPPVPSTLMGWLLFAQWALETYGELPSGT